MSEERLGLGHFFKSSAGSAILDATHQTNESIGFLYLRGWLEVLEGVPGGEGGECIVCLDELLWRIHSTAAAKYEPTYVNTILYQPPSGGSISAVPVLADFTHDAIIVAVMTAISLDHFNAAPSDNHPPLANDRRLAISKTTAFGTRSVTEEIACQDADPKQAQTKPVTDFTTLCK